MHIPPPTLFTPLALCFYKVLTLIKGEKIKDIQKKIQDLLKKIQILFMENPWTFYWSSFSDRHILHFCTLREKQGCRLSAVT